MNERSVKFQDEIIGNTRKTCQQVSEIQKMNRISGVYRVRMDERTFDKPGICGCRRLQTNGDRETRKRRYRDA